MKTIIIIILSYSILLQNSALSQTLNKSLYFASGKSELNEQNLQKLISLNSLCKQYPDVAVDIKAYADDRGTEAMNLKLSKHRASEVFNFLRGKGLNPHKQILNGLGEVALKSKENIENERQNNRRVDIIITPFAPKNWEDYYSFYQKRNTQLYKISNGRDTTLVGKKGTVIFIPANSFQASGVNLNGDEEVELKMYEAYTYKDMLFQNLTTVSDGKLLETGGMIHLQANRISDGAELNVRKDKELLLTMPSSEKLPEGMQLFTANRDINQSADAINWKTEGKKFEQPEMMKSIHAGYDYFSKLMKQKKSIPQDLNIPYIDVNVVLYPPSKPYIHPAPVRNFFMPERVPGFETFIAQNPPQEANKVHRKESKGQYKMRMHKEYRLAKLHFNRDSAQYLRKLQKYNENLALHKRSSLFYAGKMDFYTERQAIHLMETKKIRVWLDENKSKIYSWVHKAKEINELNVRGIKVRNYIAYVNKLFRLRNQMKQQAQKAGLSDLIDSLDKMSLDLFNVKKAAVKLHWAAKDKGLKLPSGFYKRRYYDYEYKYDKSSELNNHELVKLYKMFDEANQAIPGMEDLLAEFEKFSADPALQTVVNFLNDMKYVNNRFEQENQKRRNKYFIKVWESQWYDSMSEKEQNKYDKMSLINKTLFADLYVIKIKDEARLQALKVLENEYMEFFTADDKDNYSNMRVAEKERFLNNFIKNKFGSIENVVGIKELGWINCDAFREDVLVDVEFPKPENTAKHVKYYICFEGRRSVLPLKIQHSVLRAKVPEGAQVKIIGIELNAGQVALSATEGKIEVLNRKPLSPFEVVRMQDVAAVIH